MAQTSPCASLPVLKLLMEPTFVFLGCCLWKPHGVNIWDNLLGAAFADGSNEVISWGPFQADLLRVC